MGSKTTVKTNEVQKNTPPEWAAPGLAELGSRIGAIIPTMPGPKYTGDFVAQPGEAALAMPSMFRGVGDMANSLVDPSRAAMGQAFTMPSFEGPGLGAGTQGFSSYDPTAIRPVVDAAIQPVMRQLMEQVLPSLSSSATESGAYSGTRALTALPSMAIRDAGRNAMEIATGLGYQDFTDTQNRNLQGYSLGTQRGLGVADTLSQRLAMYPDLADTVMRMSGAGADYYGQAAGMETAHAQSGIDNKLAQFDYGVRHPYQGLDVAAALLGQIANPWGTRTTTGTQTQSTGGLAPIVGGLMGAGMMAMGMPGGSGSLSGLFSRKPTMGQVSTGAIGM